VSKSSPGAAARPIAAPAAAPALPTAAPALRPPARGPQLLWAFASLALLPLHLSFLPGVAPKRLPMIPHTHVDAVSGAAAAVFFISELFMIKAILVYENGAGSRGGGGGGHGHGGGGASRFKVRAGCVGGGAGRRRPPPPGLPALAPRPHARGCRNGPAVAGPQCRRTTSPQTCPHTHLSARRHARSPCRGSRPQWWP
jgi:hypothetical protein